MNGAGVDEGAAVNTNLKKLADNLKYYSTNNAYDPFFRLCPVRSLRVCVSVASAMDAVML